MTSRKAKKLFQSTEEQLQFTEDLGLDVNRGDILEHAGDNIAAAKLHLAEGRIAEAKELIRSEDSSRHEDIAIYICELLWRNSAIGIHPISRQVQDLIAIIDCLDETVLRDSVRHEVRPLSVCLEWTPSLTF